MRIRACAAAVAIAAAALPPTHALAHEGNPNFRSVVEQIDPVADGVEVEVLNFDDNLQLENRGAETVLVKGYEGEPYLRIEPDGSVLVNTRSPAHYLNRDRYAESDVPRSADSKAPARWRTVAGNGRYSWHDHRVHYMSRGVPPQVTDEDRRTKVFDYRVPIEVDGEPARIAGTLYWVGQGGGFPLVPFAGLAAFALICLVTAVIMRRRRSARRDSGPGPKEAW